MSNKDKYPLKSQDEKRFKLLFKLALYEYLAPQRCIQEYKLDKAKFDYIIKSILKSFNQTMINYGEMVGILTAQSVGEPLTQQTLSSFHKTGAGGLQGGPRFRELLSYTKNIATPYTYIYLRKEYRENKVVAQKIASYLKYTVLKNITRKVTIVYDSDVGNPKSYTNKDAIDKKSIFYINNERETSLETMPWLFRVSLSKEAMIENDINMLDMKTEFIKFWNSNYGDTMGVKKHVKDLVSKVMRGCIASNFNNSDEPTVHFRFDLGHIDNQMLMDLYDILLNKFKLKGSENIARIDEIKNNNIVTFDGPDAAMKIDKEVVIYANGIDMNLIKHIPAIDHNRTFCNSVHIILKNYGIEAARAFLVREIPLQFDKPIIPQHPQIIADLMTSTGTITSIDRHGMNRMDKDPLARASFEKMVEHFVNAAIFSETDTLQSVSSQIMVGKAFTGGTGMCEVLIDNDMLENTSNADYISNVPMMGASHHMTTTNLIHDIMNMEDIKTYIPT
jgi:DNA-directed RNA polymerase II subunit RPB1